jgi:hypothetical protein
LIFFALTGHVLEGVLTEPADCQAAVSDLYRRLFPDPPAAPPVSPPTCCPPYLPDDKVIDRARAASEQFDRLWRGELAGCATASEGDWALCKALTFWVGRDHERIDRLFRRSARLRPKWDRRAGGVTYGLRTITQAAAAQTRFFDPRYGETSSPPVVDPACLSSGAVLGAATESPSHPSSSTKCDGYSVASSADVDEALAEALPDSPGDPWRVVSRLARSLKALPHLADADARQLRDAVLRWHAAAGNNAGCSAEQALALFELAWPAVQFPAGTAPIDKLFGQAAGLSPVPGLTPRLQRLAALCLLLQRLAGAECFYLDCRTVGRLFGAHWTTAARWLRRLAKEKVIRRITKGSPATHKASRYRFVWQEHQEQQGAERA